MQCNVGWCCVVQGSPGKCGVQYKEAQGNIEQGSIMQGSTGKCVGQCRTLECRKVKCSEVQGYRDLQESLL